MQWENVIIILCIVVSYTYHTKPPSCTNLSLQHILQIPRPTAPSNSNNHLFYTLSTAAVAFSNTVCATSLAVANAAVPVAAPACACPE